MLKAVLSFQICPMSIRCPRKKTQVSTYMLTFHNHFPICSPFELPPQHQSRRRQRRSAKRSSWPWHPQVPPFPSRSQKSASPRCPSAARRLRVPAQPLRIVPGIQSVEEFLGNWVGIWMVFLEFFFGDDVLMRGICNCRFPHKVFNFGVAKGFYPLVNIHTKSY